jgi:hypothetical protein
LRGFGLYAVPCVKIAGMNPRPLDRQFSSPRDLLDKARRDLERLRAAEGNETASRDAMIDACASVYHIKDWIVAMHPDRKDDAERYAHESKWILLCRDICTAAKHVGLRLEAPTFRRSPPAVRGMDHSAVAGAFGGLLLLKVRTEDDDYYGPEVVGNAIADWDSFMRDRKIP